MLAGRPRYVAVAVVAAVVAAVVIVSNRDARLSRDQEPGVGVGVGVGS